MGILTGREKEEMAFFHRRVSKIMTELRRRSIYESDTVLGRVEDGRWTVVVYTGVNPDNEKPFYTELPDGNVSYFDRLGMYYDSNDLGTQNEIEGELTRLDLLQWIDDMIRSVSFCELPSKVEVDGIHCKFGHEEIHIMTESFHEQYSSKKDVKKAGVIDLDLAQFKVKDIEKDHVVLEYIGTAG